MNSQIIKPANQKKEILKKLRESLNDKYVSLIVVLSLIFNLATWLLLYLNIKPREEPIFLHYNIYFGIDLTGEWYKIFFIPLSGLIIILVNYFLSAIISPKSKVIFYVIMSFTLLMQFLLGLAAFLIIQINI